MIFQCKDGEHPVDPTWIKEWNDVYHNVDQEILKARVWCLDNPQNRKTKRGLRKFLGAWIRRSCPLRENVRRVQIVQEEKPEVALQTRVSFIEQMKAAVNRGETPT